MIETDDTEPAIRTAPVENRFTNMTYHQALATVASKDKNVWLTMTDFGFVKMVINMYLQCLAPQGISNYLILSVQSKVCNELDKYGINCFTYKHMEHYNQPSNYGSAKFNEKTSGRAEMVLGALRGGFTVLMSDADMVCFKNPYHYINCNACDIIAMVDSVKDNYAAGFDYVLPTAGSIAVYETMKTMVANRTKVSQFLV